MALSVETTKDGNEIMNAEQIIASLSTNETKISRIKNELRSLAGENNQYSDLLSMMADLADFMESGRPVSDWKAAESAVRNFKRNY